MFFVKDNNLPKDLTSYDLLKSLAVVMMVIDHVGSYFYPDQLWWRAAGSSVPIWFFFVGYAQSRNLSAPIWIGTLILVAADIIFAKSLFSLSILASIIIARALIDPVMSFAMKNKANLIMVSFVCVMLWLPTRIFYEYGTLSLLIAMYGWMLRREHDDVKVKEVLNGFLGFVVIFFIVTHLIVYPGFSEAQVIVFSVSSLLTFGLTYLFKRKTFPDLTQKLPEMVNSALRTMGRYSLYIYVGHIVFFVILSFFFVQEGKSLFEFSLF